MDMQRERGQVRRKIRTSGTGKFSSKEKRQEIGCKDQSLWKTVKTVG